MTQEQPLQNKCPTSSIVAGLASNILNVRGKQIICFKCGKLSYMGFQCLKKNNLHIRSKDEEQIHEREEG